MDNTEKLFDIFSRILQVDKKSITEKTSSDSVETWDSMAALLLISDIEKEFLFQFSMSEVQSIKCVGDMKSCLAQHGITFS